MTYEQALSRAAALCSASEQCPSDIHAKVIKWGLEPPEAARVVAELIKEHFLDEQRYARAFANDKYRFQHWGRVKIRYALRGKGIAEAAIETALDECIDTDDYLTDCVALLRTRMRGMSQPLSPSDRARLCRFAAQRGFEMDVISRALSRCRVEADDLD